MICLQIPTVLWKGELILSVLNVHGVNDVSQTHTYIHTYIHTAVTSARVQCVWVWDGYSKAKIEKNYQVLIKFQQNWFKQQVGPFVLRSINLLILFRIKRNCLTSGRIRIIVCIYKKDDKTDCINYQGLKQADALLPLLFIFALEYATRKV
jgi:hypothetical protein